MKQLKLLLENRQTRAMIILSLWFLFIGSTVMFVKIKDANKTPIKENDSYTFILETPSITLNGVYYNNLTMIKHQDKKYYIKDNKLSIVLNEMLVEVNTIAGFDILSYTKEKVKGLINKSKVDYKSTVNGEDVIHYDNIIVYENNDKLSKVIIDDITITYSDYGTISELNINYLNNN